MNNTKLKDTSKPKQTVVETPDWLAEEIFQICYNITLGFSPRKNKFPETIADLCCGKGAMSKYFNKVTGYDINERYEESFISADGERTFVNKDLLGHLWLKNLYDLVLINPPFNGDRKNNIVAQFIEVAFNYLNSRGYLVLLAPYNFLHDGHKKRWAEWRNRFSVFKYKTLPVHTTFATVEIQAAVVFMCRKEYINHYIQYADMFPVIQSQQSLFEVK